MIKRAIIVTILFLFFTRCNFGDNGYIEIEKKSISTKMEFIDQAESIFVEAGYLFSVEPSQTQTRLKSNSKISTFTRLKVLSQNFRETRGPSSRHYLYIDIISFKTETARDVYTRGNKNDYYLMGSDIIVETHEMCCFSTSNIEEINYIISHLVDGIVLPFSMD